MLNIYKLAAT